jgi:probable HAF family extracellular repeat protein
MKSKMSMRIAVIGLFSALAMPVLLAAQSQDQDKDKRHDLHQYHHYQLVDVGTFGGPQSFEYLGNPAPGVINNQGTFAGWADTSVIDPLCFFDQPDCYVAHAFQWKNGAKTDLGVLPGGLNSQVNWISANGLNAGVADNGQMDPLVGIPQIHAVFWAQDGGITDLGNLPEGGYQSFTAAVNRRGEVVGSATNTVPDSNPMLPGYGYQLRAFYWKNGAMQDLGTLPGGTDAQADLINERGQVVGWSYNSSNPNLDNLCFGNPLTTGSFIWDKKNGMRDLGNLGGASCTLAHNLNNRGQVIGGSDVPGEFQHPFVWDAATGLTDLGTPDGGYGVAQGINEKGDIVGLGGANGPLHAILWRKRGDRWHMTDLGTLNGGNCGFAESINESGQVVGLSGPDSCSLPFLWEDGGPIVDLNTLVPANSGIQLGEVGQINDRGEITVNGSDANGNSHAVLLIPCDENHSGIEGCDYSMVDADTAAQSAAAHDLPNSTPRPSTLWRSHRFHISGRAVEGGAAVLAVPVSPVSDYTRPHVFYVSLSVLTPSAVNPGGSSTSAVTVGISGEVAVGTAALACSVQPSPPSAPTCSISPASLPFPGTPATLTVSTVGPSGALLSRRDHGLLYALWLPLIGLVATGAGLGSNPNRQKGKLKNVALVCALFAGLSFPLACGGGSSSSQRTPPGTYTINVTATAFIPVNSSIASTTLAVQ